MTTWEEQISEVRKQMAELRTAREQNEKIVSSRKELVEEARQQLQKMLLSDEGALSQLEQFTKMVQSLNNEKLVGWILIGADGKVVMSNPTAQQLLLLDSAGGQVPLGYLCDGYLGFPLAESELPWSLTLSTGKPPQPLRLIMRRPDVSGELFIEVTTIPLRSAGTIFGVWVLFVDSTEAIKANEFIKNLYKRFEQYLSSVEDGHRELLSLTERLGVRESSMLAEPVDLEEAAEAPKSTILVVDDIAVNQKLITMQLKNCDVDVELASDGREAVDLCMKRRYALIFMDCDMPILDGYQATAEIRKFESSVGMHTPIVAMTSFDREGDREKCLAQGMDNYLVKGVSKARVREIVDQYVFNKAHDPADLGEGVECKDPTSEDELDLAWLKESFGDEANEIMVLFLGTASMLMNCLEFAFETKDAQGIRHFAFSLKGLFANLRLSLVARLAAQLSDDAANGRWREAQDQFQRLRRFVATLKIQSSSVPQ